MPSNNSDTLNPFLCIASIRMQGLPNARGELDFQLGKDDCLRRRRRIACCTGNRLNRTLRCLDDQAYTTYHVV